MPLQSPNREALLKALMRQQGLQGVSRIPRRSGGGAAPLSYGQQRLWFLDQVAPGSPVYNIPLAMTIETALDAGLLERSLNEVVRRHEVLRSRFEAGNGHPGQVVMPELRIRLEQVDLRGMGAGEQEQ